MAITAGGRVDLHGTTTTLRARVAENTPIGPEHDGTYHPSVSLETLDQVKYRVFLGGSPV